MGAYGWCRGTDPAATGLQDLGAYVNIAIYWDAGHGTNEDATDFIGRMGRITGYH